VAAATRRGDAGASRSIRALTPADREALASFSCRGYGEPWAELVEGMVREDLADALAVPGVEALGSWVGPQLCGVVVWRIDGSGPVLCRGILLAVANGHRRRGHGRRLKRELVERARRAGAVAVVSEVHRDNDPMIDLNVSLGAAVDRIDGDPDHLLCVIPA
jgi:ribosomal protein S18 acetylase RimI-like enzyme